MAKLTRIDEQYIAKIKPIGKRTLESIRKQTSKYIFVEKDGSAYCERCEHTFSVADTKHKGTIKCPSCNHKMEVWHTWRKSEQNAWRSDWIVTAKALSNTELMLQYVLVDRMGRKICSLKNCATEVTDFGKKKIYRYEKARNGQKYELNGWAKKTYDYFREFGMGYGYRTLCCLQAKVHNDLFYREAEKIDCFKYINTKEFNNDKADYYMCSILYHFSKKPQLIEKLQKSGLSTLVYADLNTYAEMHEIKYNAAETELTKMLGITKRNLNMLKSSAISLENLRRLQKDNNITDMDFADLQNFSEAEESELRRSAEKVGVSLHKVIKYVRENGIGAFEYRNFLSLSARLMYDNKDLSYSMPKDFHAECERLHEVEAKAREKASEEAKRIELAKNDILAKIKAEVESNKELAEFFKTNKKYMCYVPGSVEDFLNESKYNHNCVGKMGYDTKMVKNETFIFFIREANNPSASFVTVECFNGKIKQIMFDKNRPVGHDTEIYSFAEAFAQRLSATRKVA